ncbi:MAG: hypothetical protein AAGH82_04710, partial [Pseudomonadota bacterium]
MRDARKPLSGPAGAAGGAGRGADGCGVIVGRDCSEPFATPGELFGEAIGEFTGGATCGFGCVWVSGCCGA